MPLLKPSLSAPPPGASAGGAEASAAPPAAPLPRNFSLTSLDSLADAQDGGPLGAPLLAAVLQPPTPHRRGNLDALATATPADVRRLARVEDSGQALARYFMPNVITPPPGLAAAAGSLDANRLTLTGADGQAFLNRGGLAALAGPGVDAPTQALVGQNIDTAAVGVRHALDVGAGARLTVGADAFANQAVVGAAPSLRLALADGVRLGGAVAGFALGSGKVRVLGGYEGDDPTLQGCVLAEWKAERLGGIAFDLGGSGGGRAAQFSVGVKLMLVRGRAAVWQRYLPRELVAAALRDHRGVAKKLRGAAAALGAQAAPLPTPSLAQLAAGAGGPDGIAGGKGGKGSKGGGVALRCGEQCSVTVSGTILLGLSVGSVGLRASVIGSYSGESELILRRLDADHVELIVAPRRVVQVSVGLDVPVAAEASHALAVALAARQGFRFDLRDPAAAAALQAALEGTLPSHAQALRPLRGLDSSEMACLVRHEVLPSGVSRTYMEKAERHSSRSGGGMPRPWILPRPVAGFSHHVTAAAEGLVATQGDATLLVDTASTEKESQRLLGGTKTTLVSAALHRVESFDDLGGAAVEMDGLVLRAQMGLDRALGGARAPLGEKLTSAFGLQVPPFRRPGHRHSYEVTVERAVRPDDLAHLATLAGGPAVAAAAQAAGTAEAPLQALTAQLAALAADPEAQARAVQAYVAARRTHGMGALHRLLGGDAADLWVSTKSSAYDRPLDKVATLLLRYGPPRRLGRGERAVARRAAGRARALIDEGLAALNDDQVLRAYDPPRLLRRLQALAEVAGHVRDFRRSLVLTPGDAEA